MSIESVMPSNHLILCCLLLLLPSLFPSIRVFSSESALRIRWPEYWSFSFNTSECSGLISFRIDCFDLLAVQGTLKSLFQHHSSKWWPEIWPSVNWVIGGKNYKTVVNWRERCLNFMFNFEYLEIMEKGTVRNQFSDLAVFPSLISYVPVAQESE